MSDFLQFLNTATVDSLTKVSGISPTLAENLVSARPFESVDDCLKVHGMGKNLLARAQSSFEREAINNTSEQHSLAPVKQPDEPAALPIEKRQSPEEDIPPKENGPSFSARLGQALLWFFRTLLRLILIALLIVGFGYAIYYGMPFLYKNFVTPIERNTTRVNELEDEIISLQTQLTEINAQLTKVNNQLSEANNRVDVIEQSVQAHTTSIATLEEMQATLEAQLKDGNDKALIALSNEITTTRILDTLARARLYLAQSNFGLASEDVQSARNLLTELYASTNDEVLVQAIDRLDLSLGNLPEFPVVASGDLEIAWQILMTGESVPTPTAESTPETTATPGVNTEITPSITATP